MKKYTDKNKLFDTGGNEWADQVFCMMQNNGCLSESLKVRINNLALWIVTNHNGYQDSIRESIEELETEMNWMSIFSRDFTSKLYSLLNNALNVEIAKTK
jgi:hypothetical protein